MSTATRTLKVAPRFERSSPVASRSGLATDGRLIRAVTFAALALYGVVRWATMLEHPPTWRLLGLLAVATAIAGGTPWLRRRNQAIAIAAVLALVLISFPIAGLPWHLFVHHRIAISARHIGGGLQALAGVLVPYPGAGPQILLVIMLGAAVLLLDGAIVVAFAPEPPSDLRRASAALPLIALAVVPSTLVRPQLPYLQGLILFGLLVAFLWGDRVRRDAAGAAVVVATLAGLGAAVAAPRLDTGQALIDYRAWAGTPVHRHLDAFRWNQTYGPLHWPRTGHDVLTVQARRGDYWKAEDLDQFNGYAWLQGEVGAAQLLPTPDPVARAVWTQPLRVTIQGMRTQAVIAAGSASAPSIAGGARYGAGSGTWTTARPLGPGSSYEIRTYSPAPSPAQLGAAGGAYPNSALVRFRTLGLPDPGIRGAAVYVAFAPFHSRGSPSVVQGDYLGTALGLVRSSPYAAAYALARDLAARAASPYAFARSVERYLARFRYDEHPPVRSYPLESFLFQDELGYCQQFSGAMALLLRMGGVPARVATGFTSGSLDRVSHQYTVSDIDAHAWDEVWFPHYGWVKFDPTPASAPARGGQALLPIEKRLPGTLDGSAAPRREIGSSPGAAHAAAHRGARAGSSSLPELAGGALVALIALALVRILRRKPADQEQLLAELERAMARTGRPLDRRVTLAMLERRFHDSPAAAQYVRSLRLARYGAGTDPPTAAQRRAVRRQLRAGLGATGRLRAAWALPPRPAPASKRRRNALRS